MVTNSPEHAEAPHDRRHRFAALLAPLVAIAVALSGACSSTTKDSATTSATTSTPTSAPSSTTTSQVEAAPSRDFSKTADALDKFVAANKLNGAGLVIVTRKDGIVYEHYNGEIDAKRISLIASSSKMLTAGVLMRLDDEGVLDIDAPVATITKWDAGTSATASRITPAQLMSSSSGLVGLIGPGSKGAPLTSYLCQYVAIGSLQACGKRVFTSTEDDARTVAPDTEFRYGGAQWQVAGAVAEIASGKSWAQLIDETYVKPCGVTSLKYANHYTQIVSPDGPFSYPTAFDGDPSKLKPTDNPNMEGGAYITPRDYATLLLMHLRDGKCGTNQVLSKAAVERMHTDRIGPTYHGSTGTKLEGYGFGWWVDRDQPTFIQDAGAFGAVPWLDLERGYGAYLVVERRSTDGQKLANELRPLIEPTIDR